MVLVRGKQVFTETDFFINRQIFKFPKIEKQGIVTLQGMAEHVYIPKTVLNCCSI